MSNRTNAIAAGVIAAGEGLLCAVAGWHWTTDGGGWLDLVLAIACVRGVAYWSVEAISYRFRPGVIWCKIAGDTDTDPLAFPTEFANCIAAIYQSKETP